MYTKALKWNKRNSPRRKQRVGLVLPGRTDRAEVELSELQNHQKPISLRNSADIGDRPTSEMYKGKWKPFFWKEGKGRVWPHETSLMDKLADAGGEDDGDLVCCFRAICRPC